MHINYLNYLSRCVTNTSFINQVLSCSTKDVLTHKHLMSVIKHNLMNKLSYVNTKHYKNLFLLLQYHLMITILTSKFLNWHIMLIYPCYVPINTRKIGSYRSKNDILLYLASVTDASLICQKVLLHCAIFLFYGFRGLEVSENRISKLSLHHTLTIQMKM